MRPVPKAFDWDWKRITDPETVRSAAVRAMMETYDAEAFIAPGRGPDGADAYAVYHPLVPSDDDYMATWLVYNLANEGLTQIMQNVDGEFVEIIPDECPTVEREVTHEAVRGKPQ